jgi:hypothetical protein
MIRNEKVDFHQKMLEGGELKKEEKNWQRFLK